MIYFDNSATTITKPPEVAEAVAYAIANFGNAGRSFYDSGALAAREIYNTRAEIARLIGLDDPLNVAFTASATESLNLVIGGLLGKADHVITTVTEHNSVLRPLYLCGCDISFIDCDDAGQLLIGSLEDLVRPSTKALICTHGSNVTGNVTNAQKLYDFCKTHEILLILDISQTFGSYPVDIKTADIFCFTGHKALFGPQGTGGVVVSDSQICGDLKIVKTGGTGVHSFETEHSKTMPDIFEVGTLNSHGIYGLQKGVVFVNGTGIENVHAKEMRLMQVFYDGIKDLRGVEVFGDFRSLERIPVVSLNIQGLTSAELAERLWTNYGIATRAGSHCAPLLHKRFGTVDTGMVRFSFSYFNTEDEIAEGIAALSEVVSSQGSLR